MSNRDWILNECLSFVPSSAQAARQLLELGIRVTAWAKVMGPSCSPDTPVEEIEIDEVCWCI